MRGFPCYPALIGVKKGLDTNCECNGVAGKPVLLKIAILMFTGELGVHVVCSTHLSSCSMSHDLQENLPVQCPMIYMKIFLFNAPCVFAHIFLFSGMPVLLEGSF